MCPIQLLQSRLGGVLAAALLLLPAGAIGAGAEDLDPPTTQEDSAADAEPAFLDDLLARIMQAESGGRRFARNPRSSALGPFQFINSTFLDVARRNFAGEIADLSPAEILRLRTDVDFATRAARAFALENRAFLAARGLAPTAASLQLAHFAGPAGAARLLRADPATPVSSLLSQAALVANPFLAGMTVGDLLDRFGQAGPMAQGGPEKKGCAVKPKLAIRCNLGRASCRKWVALHQRILDRRWARRATGPRICGAAAGETGPAQLPAPKS